MSHVPGLPLNIKKLPSQRPGCASCLRKLLHTICNNPALLLAFQAFLERLNIKQLATVYRTKAAINTHTRTHITTHTHTP